MKIEVGKFYRTREGCKVRIDAVDSGYKMQQLDYIQGAIYRYGLWRQCAWEYGGKANRADEEEYDIVSEWTPQEEKLVAFVRCQISQQPPGCVDHTPIGGVRLLEASLLKSTTDYKRAPWLDEPEAK